MASQAHIGLILFLVYVILNLCTCDALDSADKYPTIEKRIFCNPSGCRNIHGKRDYTSSKKYNMFNRIRTGKRTSDSALYDNYDPLTSVQSAFEEWPSDQMAVDKSLTEELSNAHTSNNIHLFGGSDESKPININNDLDIALMNLYERYKVLKDAEEIVSYMRSAINKDNKKQINKRKFTDWLERRK